MGQSGSKQSLSFDEWQKMEEVNGIEIFKHNKTNEFAEKRTITVDPHFDLDDELNIYQMREDNNDALVRAFAARQVENKNHSKGICSGHKKLQVLTERIPYRLSSLPQVTFPESLLFLRQSLKAYNKVFRSYGAIHITKRLIGINDYGEVRCWVNENWALNHPDHDLPILQSTKLEALSQTQSSSQISNSSQVYDPRYRDETQMVHNIVGIIQSKCEQGKFPEAFKQQIERYCTSFKKLSLYLEDFIGINQLFIPPKISYNKVYVGKQQEGFSSLMLGNVTSQHDLGLRNTFGYQSPTFAAYTNQEVLPPSNQIAKQMDRSAGHLTSPPRQEPLQNTTSNMTNSFEKVQGGVNLALSPGITQNEKYKRFLLNETLISSITADNYQNSTYEPIKYTEKLPLSSYNFSQAAQNNPKPVSIQIGSMQKNENYHKPGQINSNYSSSYYQYSATNPSIFGNYQTGVVPGGTQHNEDKRFSSDTTLSYRLGSNYNFSNPNNIGSHNFFQTKPAALQAYNNIPTAYSQYKGNYGIDRFQKAPSSFEQYKKNFGKNPFSDYSNFYPYSSTFNAQKQVETSNQDPRSKGFVFSFDGKKDFNSKLGDYTSKTFSSSLPNYETTSTNPTFVNENYSRGEGKYNNELNSSIGQSLGNSLPANAIINQGETDLSFKDPLGAKKMEDKNSLQDNQLSHAESSKLNSQKSNQFNEAIIF